MTLVEALASIRTSFLERTGEELAVLRAVGGDTPEAAQIIHRLAGAAGVFGFHDLSRAALAADQQIHEAGSASPAAFAELIGALETVLAEV